MTGVQTCALPISAVQAEQGAVLQDVGQDGADPSQDAHDQQGGQEHRPGVGPQGGEGPADDLRDGQGPQGDDPGLGGQEEVGGEAVARDPEGGCPLRPRPLDVLRRDLRLLGGLVVERLGGGLPAVGGRCAKEVDSNAIIVVLKLYF